MDYNALAEEFVRNMRSAQTAMKHKPLPEDIRGESLILFCIANEGGRTVPGELSNMMCVSSARVATVLNSLEDKELITRRIDVSDRRKIIVEITPKGERHVNELQKKQIEMMKDILISLGEEDAEELVRIVGRLAEVLSKIESK
ncbi:MAG: MarR family transcriptional regulator [Candidatus Methanoplasma sp.]|jgi:DNA-binding MarR family transcriptional regulator|nr:MarR family transcriptional regulator [Candidatus Methanoplasma sp.]